MATPKFENRIKMKTTIRKILPLFLLFFSVLSMAQYGYGSRYGGYGRRSSIPQAQTPEKEPEKLTAEEIVEQEMPKIIETLALDPFEEAIMRTTLVNSVKKRMELQILNLEPQKMREEFKKIQDQQEKELKAGLPPEKYQIYLDMRENPTKTKRKQKKKKKKSKT